MSNLQVLVVTMGQSDFSLVERMNLKCDAIIANQAEKDDINETVTASGMLKMITTPTRGVGINRNIALLSSTADILLFSDDDMVYYDGLKEGVVAAFEQLPQADVIIFSTDIMKNGIITEKRHLPTKRRRLWNSLQYGTYAFAIRKKALLRANLSFHQAFGGGCIYGSGEDSLFICDCFKKRLRVYSHNYVLGICIKDTSSWFRGFNNKYFYDRGALFYYAFPKVYYVLIPYFAIKMVLRKKTELSLIDMIRQMQNGAKNAKQLLPYKE